MHVTHCRLCLRKVEHRLALKPTPIANAFTDEPQEYALKFPLDLFECPSCGHVQLGYHVKGEELFGNYAYRTPDAERSRLALYAVDLARKYPGAVSDKPTVLEIGSNRGLFIEELRRVGFQAVGIDPAGPRNGLPRWWNSKAGRQVAQGVGKMKLILANNVFAHVDDLRNALLGASYAMDDDGVLVFEVQYFPAMAKRGLFDMIYHEHRDYHTLKPLPAVLQKFGFAITEVEHIPTHGGSIRVHCKRGGESIPVAQETIDWEGFGRKIESEKTRLLNALNGESVVAFGATAKACTLIHQLGIRKQIKFCVDETPTKQGKYIPGTAIEIVGPEKMGRETLFLTAWNYEDVIRARFPDKRMVVPFSTT